MRARVRLLLTVPLLFTGFPALATAQHTLGVTGLRHEYRINPLGTDAVQPRLSWRIEGGERNTVQSAYQLQVAADSTSLTRGTGLRWDSGRIITDASLFQPYNGPALQSRTRYFWRVRVWDGKGSASAWSAPAFWETALLDRTDWAAQWIGRCCDGCSISRERLCRHVST
jgi:alpha-L-rhamnosidase